MEEKVALVSGGTGGLGKATVIRLARDGYAVYLASRSLARADSVVRELESAGCANVRPMELDVTEEASIRRAVELVNNSHGRMDVLVNNAGVAATSPAVETSFAQWSDVLSVNLTGPFLLARDFFQLLRSSQGVVVNVASVAGLRGQSYIAAYAAAKGGLMAVTRALAVEWARYDVRVVAIAPGYILTDLNRDVLEQPDIRDKILRRTPLRRFAEPHEVADAIGFIVSSSFLTGSTLVHDGGWTAA